MLGDLLTIFWPFERTIMVKKQMEPIHSAINEASEYLLRLL